MMPPHHNQFGLPPGLVDIIGTFDMDQPPEWFSLPVFLFYIWLQQFDMNRRYAKEYVEFGQLQTVLGQLYQCGAILGHLQHERGIDLMRLSMGRVRGDSEKLFSMFKRRAMERVESYQRATGRLPDSIPVMQYTTGYREAGLDILKESNQVKIAARQRTPLEDAEAFAVIAFNEGIAFAITHARLWEQAMIAHDGAHRQLSAYSDVQLPDMEALRAMTLDLGRTWATMFRPDLLHLIPESHETRLNARFASATNDNAAHHRTFA